MSILGLRPKTIIPGMGISVEHYFNARVPGPNDPWTNTINPMDKCAYCGVKPAWVRVLPQRAQFYKHCGDLKCADAHDKAEAENGNAHLTPSILERSKRVDKMIQKRLNQPPKKSKTYKCCGSTVSTLSADPPEFCPLCTLLSIRTYGEKVDVARADVSATALPVPPSVSLAVQIPSIGTMGPPTTIPKPQQRFLQVPKDNHQSGVRRAPLKATQAPAPQQIPVYTIPVHTTPDCHHIPVPAPAGLMEAYGRLTTAPRQQPAYMQSASYGQS